MKYLTDFETKAAYDAAKKDLPKPQIALVRDTYNVHFAPKKVGPEYDKEYFTIIAKEDGKVTFKYGVKKIPPTLNSTNSGLKNASLPFTSISYSLNDGAWETTEYNQQGGNTIEVSVSSGDKVRWKGINHTLATPLGGTSYFTSDCPVDVEGNIMSLLFDDEFIGETNLEGRDGAFAGLFCNMDNYEETLRVVSAENLMLPATTLASDCYNSMFANCASLTTALELPATTLADSCYYAMFANCTSLTEAPQLLATTLTDNCYAGMFDGCTSLNHIECLATSRSGKNCTDNWVNGVAENGTFIRDENTLWLRGESGIPNGWDVEPPLLPLPDADA